MCCGAGILLQSEENVGGSYLRHKKSGSKCHFLYNYPVLLYSIFCTQSNTYNLELLNFCCANMYKTRITIFYLQILQFHTIAVSVLLYAYYYFPKIFFLHASQSVSQQFMGIRSEEC